MPTANQQPIIQPNPASKFWENKAADLALRMRVNGENARQMEWAAKEAASGRDHSVDEAWEQDPKLAWVDRYLKRVLIMMLIPKALLMIVPLMLAAAPVTLTMTLYGMCMPASADRPARGCAFFLVFYILGPLLLLPFAFFGVVGLLYDYAYYYLFGIPLWLMRGAPSRAGSFEVIAPFRAGPSLWTHPADFLVCMLGQVNRQGMGASRACMHRMFSWVEVSFLLAVMIIGVPSLKYWMNCNPWAFDLKQRYIQQITTTCHDVPAEFFGMTLRLLVTRCKQRWSTTHLLDTWRFLPYYPNPPPSRRWAIGCQQGGKLMMLLTHSTHANVEARGVRETLLVSNSASMPGYRVMLWYNNPFHFFTGFVEASPSNGGQSQSDKPMSGEHPMWIVTSNSPMLSRRTKPFPCTGCGFMDNFFDVWLPEFVNGVWTLHFGREYAEANHEVVVSKDGISRPSQETKVLPHPPYK